MTPPKNKPRIPVKVRQRAQEVSARPLTHLERKFVDAYDGGDPMAALREAGANGPDHTLAAQAERMLAIPAVRRAIRAKEGLNDTVADEVDIKEFLTRTLFDPGAQMKDRLRAAELLGKTTGMFIDKVEQTGGDLLTLINASTVIKE